MVVPDDIWELLETDIKYEGYAARQAQHNRELSKKTFQRIPDGFNFSSIAGLSSETRQKLSKVRPLTLGQATRISGVTPADISILSIWLSKNDLEIKQLSLQSKENSN
jgi:tRNA uridine 5-carboxymethylaminomethyl modification enzyme